MKRIEISAYGPAEDVAHCVEAADVGAPGDGEVVFEVLAFPINPADIWFCRGTYRLRPPLPATPGAECVGRVVSVGRGVTRVAAGDLVINLQRENWTQRRKVGEADVIRLPPGINLRQAAMIRINPPTALLMLTDLAPLKAGDWIIQNAANSAVGRLVIVLAKYRGIKTLNVVRRADAIPELLALGGDACLVDSPDLAARIREAAGGEDIRLGIDAVAGEATARLAGAVADGGVVCNYGSMSDADPVVAKGDLIFRGVSLTGFMVGRVLAQRTADEIDQVYGTIADMVMSGQLVTPVEQVYPIEEIRAALLHAQRSRQGGKILVAPNGSEALLDAS